MAEFLRGMDRKFPEADFTNKFPSGIGHRLMENQAVSTTGDKRLLFMGCPEPVSGGERRGRSDLQGDHLVQLRTKRRSTEVHQGRVPWRSMRRRRARVRSATSSAGRSATSRYPVREGAANAFQCNLSKFYSAVGCQAILPNETPIEIKKSAKGVRYRSSISDLGRVRRKSRTRARSARQSPSQRRCSGPGTW